MADTADGASDMIRVILTRAASDPALRAQLVAGGAAALRALGVGVPEGVTVRFVEDSLTERHLVIPIPAGAELTDADLDKVAGGAGQQLQQMGGQQMGRGPSFGGFG